MRQVPRPNYPPARSDWLNLDFYKLNTARVKSIYYGFTVLLIYLFRWHWCASRLSNRFLEFPGKFDDKSSLNDEDIEPFFSHRKIFFLSFKIVS